MERYVIYLALKLALALLLCGATPVLAETVHPLKPVDVSSPRATLNSLLSTMDTLMQLMHDEYWDSPSHAGSARLLILSAKAEQTLNLSKVPPATRFEVGRDGVVYLYEVLSRIELPPDSEIPDALSDAVTKDSQGADNGSPSWTVPHTEITIARVATGEHEGDFLFTPATVAHAQEFYKKTKILPYQRNVPIENFPEMRAYLCVTGWFLSSSAIEEFPEWLKHSVYDQAVWKWIVLVILALISTGVLIVLHKLVRQDLTGHSVRNNLRRLVTPVVLLLLLPLLLRTVNQQLALNGLISELVILSAEVVIYISLVWMAWTGSIAIAEAIITSPKIPDHSLNAHLLRLSARTLGIAVVIIIIFHFSNRLGAPLYSLVAGLGVGGIAIALAAQPTIENFIGSLNLFADHPVRVGDFCRFGEDPTLEWKRIGTVESIGLRSTRIRGIDHTVTTIPNADFSKMQIVNYSIRKNMLLLTVLGLRYETTDDQLRYVLAMLRKMLVAHPRVIDQEPRVRFSGFGDSSLNVEIRISINTQDRNEFPIIREDIFLRIIKIIRDAGTGFAFPSRTVYHTSDNGVDKKLQQDAEAQVQNWCNEGELPFPNFPVDYRVSIRNTLIYPPEGSPEADD